MCFCAAGPHEGARVAARGAPAAVSRKAHAPWSLDGPLRFADRARGLARRPFFCHLLRWLDLLHPQTAQQRGAETSAAANTLEGSLILPAVPLCWSHPRQLAG